MSQLEVNSIDKYSGNNLSVGSQLNLKSYTTTQRDALTSVAGDTIYNTDDNKVQFYNGSAWADTGTDVLVVDYLVVAGGGSGGAGSSNTGDGGAGTASAGSFNSGGSGVVILRYPKAFTITVGGSLTSSTATDGDYKVTTFTAGTDNVSWA